KRHNFKDDVASHLNDMEKRLGALADLCQCATEEDGNQEHLKDIALDKTAHHCCRDEFHQELNRAATGNFLRSFDIGGEGRRIELADVDVHAVSRTKDIGNDNAERERDCGDDLKIDKSPDAD